MFYFLIIKTQTPRNFQSLETHAKEKMAEEVDFINNNNSDEEDRLSSLPDSLLIEILSLLPFKSAVATSALSRRWVPLWTHLPHLLLGGFDHPLHTDTTTAEKFFTTVNHIFSQLTSPQNHTFYLHYYHPISDALEFQLCYALFTSWVPLICARNAVKFEVCLDSLEFCGHSIILPTCVFQTPSLVHLKLRGSFHCKLPETGIVNLPNLKKLSLCGVNFDTLGLTTLFKCCPLLENLFLELKLMEDEVIEISAHNLKYLSIHLLGSSTASRFMIDVPLLEEIAVHDSGAFYNFVKKPCMLRKACIEWPFRYREGNDYLVQIPELFRGISSVRSIHLLNSFPIIDIIQHMDGNIWSLFHNLTDLRLGVSNERMNWGSSIPSALLPKLKRIRISGIHGDRNDVRSLKYVLSNPDVLEHLNLYLVFDSNNSPEHVFKELSKLQD